MPRDDLPDLTLYYVASSTGFPSTNAFLAHIKSILSTGAVSAIQLREKTLDTPTFTSIAEHVHVLTKDAGIPLFINDNVDVCKAVGAEGLHIGWKDAEFKSARSALPENTIIGLSASNITQARACVSLGADYIGLGPVFPTNSKADAAPTLYPAGASEILSELRKLDNAPPVVLIGGINAENVQALKYRLRTSVSEVESDGEKKGLENVAEPPLLAGIAVISAISAAEDPVYAARELRQLYTTSPRFLLPKVYGRSRTISAVLSAAPHILAQVGRKRPLVHHMTNSVVQTLSANVTLAIGASPIMSQAIEEVEELADINGALVLNIGTLNKDTGSNFRKALSASNKRGVPVVFDPVGVGASKLRKAAARDVLESGYVGVLKGNEAELAELAGEKVIGAKGVDSGAAAGSEPARLNIAKSLARRYKNIVVMTGKTDIVTDGNTAYLLDNGHFYQGLTTGAGCALASIIAACVAVGDDALSATTTAVCAYNIAAELAGKHNMGGMVKGPGTFVPVWLDELWKLKCASEEGMDGWVGFARARREGEAAKFKGSREMAILS